VPAHAPRDFFLSARDSEACTYRQGGELLDRVTAGPPIDEFLFIEALGHVRIPFAAFWPDHRAGVELAAIDTHGAPEAAADLEGRRLDDRGYG
jgi:hypothetical protein